jgi:general secretion pathway protein A
LPLPSRLSLDFSGVVYDTSSIDLNDFDLIPARPIKGIYFMQLDYYRLSEKPFELSPDLKFLFLTPSYLEAKQKAEEGIINRKGLMILTGEAGTGKTMLIYSLMSGLPSHIKTALIFHSTFNFKEILNQIFSELGDPHDSGEKQDLQIKLLDHLRKLKERGEVLAVFIDEAQKLSPEALRGLFHLLNMEPWIHETLQLILVGQTEFEKNLNTVAAGYTILHAPRQAYIPVLSPQESKAYIEHRLNIAGRSSAEIFSPQALSAITEYSQGIPRLLNVVCDNALFKGYADSKEKIDIETIRKVIRNLEGPGAEIKIGKKDFKKDPSATFRSRISSRLSLGLLAGVSLAGAALLFWHFDIAKYLKGPGRPAPVRTFMSQQKNLEKIIKAMPETRKPAEAHPPEPAKTGTPVLGKEPAPSSAEGSPGMGRIKVRAGESLSILAFRFYGKINESLIHLIASYNPAIKNLDLILVDQEIKIPELREESLIFKGHDQNYILFLGIFTNSNVTQSFTNQPVLKGKEITVQPNIIGKKQRGNRIEAGFFKSRSEALEALKDLRQKNLLPFF